MRADSVIYLITTDSKENDIGDSIKNQSGSRKVFAEKKSVRQSEFYQAAATDLKPELSFEMWAVEYKGEVKLKYLSKHYEIIRTFGKGEKIELICSGIVNKGVSNV